MNRILAAMMFISMILGVNVAAADAPQVTCTQNEDCKGSGFGCINEHCLQDGECITGADCASTAEFCAAGRCVPCGELVRCNVRDEPAVPPVEDAPPPKPRGPPKPKFCWDTFKVNNKGDVPEEDANGDGVVDLLDCHGEDGTDGKDGTNGVNGRDGTKCWDLNGDGDNDREEDLNGDGQFTPGGDCNGIPCWDTNFNHVRDPTEDVSGDGNWDTSDCQPPTLVIIGPKVEFGYRKTNETDALRTGVGVQFEVGKFRFDTTIQALFGDEPFTNFYGGIVALDLGGELTPGIELFVKGEWGESSYDPTASWLKRWLDLGLRLKVKPLAFFLESKWADVLEIDFDFLMGPHYGPGQLFKDADWPFTFGVGLGATIPFGPL